MERYHLIFNRSFRSIRDKPQQTTTAARPRLIHLCRLISMRAVSLATYEGSAWQVACQVYVKSQTFCTSFIRQYIVKYWNKLPASVVTAPSVNVFKKRLEEVWTEVFPHLPHWLNTHPPPFSLPPPTFPPAHHPLTVIMSIHNPTPCFTYVVSSGPLWPTFYNNKS